jgi:CII-binding regulator of phage lambda lysogenization HflD
MTWLSIATFFKKVWYFFKTYWYIPLSLSWAIIAWLLLRKSSGNILDVLHSAEESFKQQLEAINDAHGKEIKKRDEVIRRYQLTIKQLEEERRKKNEELTEKEKKRIKELAEKHKEDPEGFVKDIADNFGFEVVEPE